MNKIIKTILIFIISFIAAYLIVGYAASNIVASIHWNESATTLDKLREYYIRTFSFNIIPALIMAVISTISIILCSEKSS